MKTAFIALTLFGILAKCSFRSNAITDCGKFKNGKFSLPAELDRTNYLIDRQDSIQLETNQSNGNVTKWRVVWIEPCIYELWFLPEKPFDNRDSFFMMNPFVNKILSATENYYIFQSSMEANGYKAVDTIFLRHTE